jgi:hypothetical protein
MLIEMAEGGLHLMRDDAPLPVRHAVNIDAPQRVRDADVAGLRENVPASTNPQIARSVFTPPASS